ncbi:Ecp2 effector-like protein [Dothistroma septosporum NZE10]|uniref:Ecp2 effector-like protein n=1 Tax=Dothistroma septosporum (strain NZE10 / CBS 128990) TaxID=675120 RepID=N1PR61_DOTSN|nr:Ecp2 effector-like protein [Dothistroma septosporum NZE10]
MLYSTAVVVALLPTFGVATRFLQGSGHSKAISPQALQQSGGQVGQPDLATSLKGDGGLPSSVQDFAEGDSPQGNGNAGHASGVNDCGFSNFVQLKEDQGYSQASVQDCYYLIWSIQADEEWIITQELQTIVENGTCAFQAVVSHGQGNSLVAALGNADIIDLVTDSIKQFGADGYVGCHGGFGMYTSAAGAMPCDSPTLDKGEQVFVDWFLTTPEGISGSVSGSSGDDGSGDDDSEGSDESVGTDGYSHSQGAGGGSDWVQANQKQQYGSGDHRSSGISDYGSSGTGDYDSTGSGGYGSTRSSAYGSGHQ